MGTLDHLLCLDLMVDFPSFPFPPGHPRVPQLSLPGWEVVQPLRCPLCGCPPAAAVPPVHRAAAPQGASVMAAEQLAGSRQL